MHDLLIINEINLLQTTIFKKKKTLKIHKKFTKIR